MKEAIRKISVKFFTEEAINEFSKKLITTNQELTKNVKELHITYKTEEKSINELNYKLIYRKPVFQKPKDKKEWEYHWNDLTPFYITPSKALATIEMYFPDCFTNSVLAELFNQSITNATKSISYPKAEVLEVNKKRWLGERGNPKYPIYIISKGRSETCITADHLIKMEIPFHIVIEEQEHEDYARFYGDNPLVTLLHLDLKFRKEYDTYIEDFDETKSKGSGPSRNFVWNHAKESGAKWHWIMDDNIMGFYYYNDNQRIKAVDGTLFATAEDFVDRYENIGIAGLNYFMFAVPGAKDRPYVANTKIYSCLLIRNDTTVRWAGRYNEDVDVCIRALKEGYSTIQFDAFLSDKMQTQSMGGGNTDAFYAEEGTLPKSNMLMHNHPDITEVMWRFQRWHHLTNYDIFDYYKDRNLKETIQDMMKPQILDRILDADIINEISKIDFSKLKKWDILKDIPNSKREKIFECLKFYRYKKNTEEIIDIITRPQLISCDLDSYLLDNDIPDTLDNKIMLDIFNLGEHKEDKLFYWRDFNEYFSYVPEERRKLIIAELIRNKYLQKPYEKYTYNIKEVILSQEDHLQFRDSKPVIQNILNIDGISDRPEIATRICLRKRGELKVQNKKKFKVNLTARGSVLKKEHEGKTLMLIGDENFDSTEIFESTTEQFIKDYNIDEIINSVNYKVDLMSANFALDKKLKNREFVPDLILHTKGAYAEMYKNMVQYTDYCIIFSSDKLTKDLEFLVEQLKINNKEYIIKYKNIVADEW
jgi:hypothetical protein